MCRANQTRHLNFHFNFILVIIKLEMGGILLKIMDGYESEL